MWLFWNSFVFWRKGVFIAEHVTSITSESENDLRVIESPILLRRSGWRIFCLWFSKDRNVDEDSVITYLARGVCKDIHRKSLFIYDHVGDIERHSLRHIKSISISPKNQHLHSERCPQACLLWRPIFEVRRESSCFNSCIMWQQRQSQQLHLRVWLRMLIV